MEQRRGLIPSLQILLFSFLSCQALPSPTGTAKHGVLYSHPLLWRASLSNPSNLLHSFQSHYVGHDIQPELAPVPGTLHPRCSRELAKQELQLCLTRAALQVIAFTVAEAGVVKHGLKKTAFPLLSPDFTLFDQPCSVQRLLDGVHHAGRRRRAGGRAAAGVRRALRQPPVLQSGRRIPPRFG